MILHNKPYFDKSDEEAVVRAIQSGYVAQGHQVKCLENELATYIGIKQSVLVNSGTTALYFALYTLGVEKDDEVILPTYVCSALLNAINMRGAKPVLTDINELDFNINWEDVDRKIGKRTKAIIVPHIHGCPSFILGDKYNNIPIIEDCATALGSYIVESGKKEHVGNKGVLSIMSFYATKFCAMGYGGFVMTNNDELNEKVINYREFDCVEEYEPRFNFQVSDLNAALGRSQLRKVNLFLERRKAIRERYDEAFDKKGITRQNPQIDCEYNNYRYIIRLTEAERGKFSEYLQDKGVRTIIPIETYELLHNYLKLEPNDYPVAENVAKTSLSIPCYPSLKDEELDYIIKTINRY